MRVLASILLIAVVLQGTLAVTSKSTQNKLLIQKLGSTLEKSHLGRALKNMAKLSQALGNPLDTLIDAIIDLQNDLLAGQNDEKLDYESEQEVHNELVASLEASIAEYKSTIANLEVELANEQAVLAQEQATLAAQEAERDRSWAALQTAQYNLETLHANYDSESAEYQEALQALGEAIALLQGAQSHYDAANLDEFPQSSFIQMNNQIKVHVAALEKATKKFTGVKKLMVTPALSVLAQTNAESSEDLSRAIELLVNLQTYLIQGLQQLDAGLLSFGEQFALVVATESAIHSSLVDVEIPITEGNIELAEENIANFEANIALNEEALAQTEAYLVQENERWAARTARHEAIQAEYNREYSILAQALAIVQNLNVPQ